MTVGEINERGLLLIGCGKMGSALLSGWLDRGVGREAVTVIEPSPSEWLRESGVTLNPGTLPVEPAICLLAVKPQFAREALEGLGAVGGGSTVVISIIAGLPVSWLESVFGDRAPIIRTMPNTPAAIGQGITAIFGNRRAGAREIALAELLMAAVGDTVRLDREELMDAVTALSGSGPAYVFHLIEAMTEAGMQLGLEEGVAARLAGEAVAGAGQLARVAGRSPAELRQEVTSPGGTTQAALEHLMHPVTGLRPLMARTMSAAEARGRELGRMHD